MATTAKSTMQLYHMAMALEPSAAHWCEQLGVSRNTLAVAKIRGRLSPTVAGNLARLLGEPIDKWIALAALEAEPASYGRDKLAGMLTWSHATVLAVIENVWRLCNARTT